MTIQPARRPRIPPKNKQVSTRIGILEPHAHDRNHVATHWKTALNAFGGLINEYERAG